MKLVSINIEGDNHLDLVIPFLQKENADVIGMMEVFQEDIPRLERETGMKAIFSPTTRITNDISPRMKPRGLWGVALFSKNPLSNMRIVTYSGKPGSDNVPVWDGRGTWNKALIGADADVSDSTSYRIITTHFTWSAKGLPTDVQRSDMNTLLAELDKEKEFVICGDFNAPRGGPIWNRLAARYKDNIPSNVVTTIDNKLHKDGKNNIQFVVDGMFSTPGYEVKNVRVVSGVSDHMAVVGEVTRRG